jgi:hypothetical protein
MTSTTPRACRDDANPLNNYLTTYWAKQQNSQNDQLQLSGWPCQQGVLLTRLELSRVADSL